MGWGYMVGATFVSSYLSPGACYPSLQLCILSPVIVVRACVSCLQEGGRSIIEEIMKAYTDDEDIIRHGKSAILSMSALENLSKSAAIAAQAKARKVVAEEAPKDVLAEYRCVCVFVCVYACKYVCVCVLVGHGPSLLPVGRICSAAKVARVRVCGEAVLRMYNRIFVAAAVAAGCVCECAGGWVKERRRETLCCPLLARTLSHRA